MLTEYRLLWVRSYGIVMWEMATLAAQPYQGLANEQVVKFVSEGKVMEEPAGCPTKLYVGFRFVCIYVSAGLALSFLVLVFTLGTWDCFVRACVKNKGTGVMERRSNEGKM